jgi:hypothetical protein
MKNKMMRLISGTLLICTLFISGCEKDKKSSAPELPPLSTFSIDLTQFNTGTKSTATYNNAFTAALVTGYWNTVLTAYLVVPVVSYAEAFKHQARRVDNNTFEWSYDVVVNDTNYTANLFARVDGDVINLEMHISQQGGFQDFIWYDGSCNVQRTEGEWTIQDNPESNTSWVSIVWNHDYEQKTFDVKYTNIYPSSDYLDSYIQYGIRIDSAYDGYYEIYNATENKTYQIDLNTTTHEGRIFYDALWHCWDNQYMDIICPE